MHDLCIILPRLTVPHHNKVACKISEKGLKFPREDWAPPPAATRAAAAAATAAATAAAAA